MTENWPRCVLMSEHSEYRGLLADIARKLKAGGSEVHWFCATEQERQYYSQRHGDLFNSMTIANRLYTAAAEPTPDTESVIERARGNEDRLGVTYNTIAVGDRHLGRGYALGGHHHPRSTISENTSYIAMLHAYNELIAFWEHHIETRGADLIINGGKAAALLGRLHGIPYRKLVGSRYGNYHYWAVDEFYENPELEPRFHQLEGQDSALQMETPYETHLQMRSWLKKQLTLGATLRNLFMTLSRYSYWTLRGYEKAKGYYLGNTLRFIWRRYADSRALARITKPLSSLADTPFVYYPLHTEPEAAVQVLSPEYFYQLSSIAALSRDLPAGAKLAVKETFAAVGRRPRDFYRQIADLKNVVWLDTAEYGLEVAANCAVVATITGSGGFEGAVMGKPVVSFGHHNIYKFLNHVKVAHDERDLAPFLAHALGPNFDHEKAKRDGRCFLQAVVDCSIDLKDFNVRDPDKADPALADTAVQKLVEGISLRSPSVAYLRKTA